VTDLGPLRGLLDDAEVSEVMVNGPGLPVWVERAGALVPTDLVLDRAAVDLAVERIAAPLGLRVDRTRPAVDARLPDGSRVHIVVPPLAVDGPCITIRRFVVRSMALAELCPPGVDALLAWSVAQRRNVLVVGATASGKTTLLNALAAAVGAGERIVTVEDAAELELHHPHVVRLEARAGSGAGTSTVRELLRNALRMRPDRLVVGEVRGAEALDLLIAMNTGHDGAMATLHANGAAEALDRLETLALLAGSGLPLPALRRQVAASLDLVVHVGRGPGASRGVVEVREVDAEPGRAGTVLAGPDGVLGAPTRLPRRPGAPGAGA
jgi:pilus assembly protein CpaF